MGILENLGLSGLSNTLSGLGNTISNFGDNIDNRTGGLLTRLGQPDNQANLITAASLLSGEGIPASFALRNQVRSNLLANQQLKNQREFIKKQFPNDPLAQAFPQIYAKQFLEKKFSTTAPKVDDLNLGNTQSERQMGNLIRLSNKIKSNTATSDEVTLYGMLYENAKKGQTFQQTDPTTGVTTTFQSGKMNLAGLPVPEGYDDKEVLTTSAKYTDSQRTASGFANRMIVAETDLSELEGLGYNPAEDIIRAYAGDGTFTRGALSDEAQRYATNALAFINAVLRKESGAAIGQEEFRTNYNLYFAQLGDSAESLALKKKFRQTALQSMIDSTGGHFQSLERNKDFNVGNLYNPTPPQNNNVDGSGNNYQTMGAAQFLEIYKQAEAEKNKPPAQRIYSEDEYKKIMKEFMRRTN